MLPIKFLQWLTIWCTLTAIKNKVREVWAVAGDCSVSRLPHEDQDKEDPSRHINYYDFLRTLTQTSAGCEIAGLELKFWSLWMDTGKVKGRKKMDCSEDLLLHCWSCGSLQHWTLCLLWIRWTEWSGSTWEMSQSVSRISCLVVLQPLGYLPVSHQGLLHRFNT